MKAPEDRIWMLLSRKFSNSITPAEDTELKQLLRHRADAQYAFDILKKIWRLPPETEWHTAAPEGPSGDGEQGLPLAPPEKDLVGRRTGMSRRLVLRVAVAAAVLIMAGAVFFAVQKAGHPEKGLVGDEGYTINTKAGEKRNITLPDRTEVWLNAASSLSYGASFATDSVRSVVLIGEAYFNVRHDEDHPFLIHTANMDIRDIGTSFNVKAYPGEALTEATLISGVIEITVHDNQDKKIRLKPNEKILVYQNKHFERYSPADSLQRNTLVQDIQVNGYRIAETKEDPQIRTYPETAWIQNDLVFKNQPFEELARTMERRYAVKIVIADAQISQYQLTGIFRNETVEQALAELQIITPFKYVIKDSVITIY